MIYYKNPSLYGDNILNNFKVSRDLNRMNWDDITRVTDEIKRQNGGELPYIEPVGPKRTKAQVYEQMPQHLKDELPYRLAQERRQNEFNARFDPSPETRPDFDPDKYYQLEKAKQQASAK